MGMHISMKFVKVVNHCRNNNKRNPAEPGLFAFLNHSDGIEIFSTICGNKKKTLIILSPHNFPTSLDEMRTK